MKELSRREFVKAVSIGGVVLGLGGIALHKPLKALASGKYDIGQCKSVRIKCISELGWYDTGVKFHFEQLEVFITVGPVLAGITNPFQKGFRLHVKTARYDDPRKIIQNPR